jgi:predicted outer membrane repeat protein
VLLALTGARVFANTIHVPGDYGLQDAINHATPGDTVLIAAGYYNVTSAINLTSGITVRSEDGLPSSVTISGGNSSRVMQANWVTEVTLLGLTIRNGYVGSHSNGAGLHCTQSELLLDQVDFRDNGLAQSGGGLYCLSSDVTLVSCTFESNEVGYLDYTQTTWIYRGSGGGACFTDASTVVATDVTFDSNHTWYEGAGLCVHGAGTRAELIGCVFVGNTTSTDEGYMGAEQRGAALSVAGGADVVLNDVRFLRNWSYRAGAAVYCGGATATMRDCVFSECRAETDGGAILAHYGGSVSATGCFFRRNSARGRGGAVYGYVQAGLVAADISAYPWGSVAVSNSILTYGSGGDVVSGDVEVAHCCVLEPEPGSGLCDEPHENVCADPLFCPSRVRDFTLCSNSPCLPQNNEWGELIGAAGEGCGPCNTPVLETSWGSIKAMFRGN